MTAPESVTTITGLSEPVMFTMPGGETRRGAIQGVRYYRDGVLEIDVVLHEVFELLAAVEQQRGEILHSGSSMGAENGTT